MKPILTTALLALGATLCVGAPAGQAHAYDKEREGYMCGLELVGADGEALAGTVTSGPDCTGTEYPRFYLFAESGEINEAQYQRIYEGLLLALSSNLRVTVLLDTLHVFNRDWDYLGHLTIHAD